MDVEHRTLTFDVELQLHDPLDGLLCKELIRSVMDDNKHSSSLVYIDLKALPQTDAQLLTLFIYNESAGRKAFPKADQAASGKL